MQPTSYNQWSKTTPCRGEANNSFYKALEANPHITNLHIEIVPTRFVYPHGEFVVPYYRVCWYDFKVARVKGKERRCKACKKLKRSC